MADSLHPHSGTAWHVVKHPAPFGSPDRQPALRLVDETRCSYIATTSTLMGKHCFDELEHVLRIGFKA